MKASRPAEPAVAHALPAGMQVFERGWLSSNCILFADAEGATLVDSGYVSHAEQTHALVMRAVEQHATPRLRRIVNTHLHSDHCGGNALIARLTECEIIVPEGNAQGVRQWDPRSLSFEMLGQRCERFDYTDTFAPGDVLMLAGVEWEALAAPGHDVDSLMLFCRQEGILVSADALWQDGCGAMFPTANPETLAEDFAAAFETFDLVEALDVRLVVPGHSAPFTDVGGALDRARSRLRRLSADPAKNALHVAKVLTKYRLLEERRLSMDTVHAMFGDTPGFQHANRDFDGTPAEFADRAIDDLVRIGVATRDGDWLVDA